MEPPRRGFHRQVSEDRGGGPQAACRERLDRRRSGGVSPGRLAALRTKAGGEQASFVTFDLLSPGGDDLKPAPLKERRDALARLVAGVDAIRFSEALTGEGATVFAHASRSRYRSGPSRNWLKCLNPGFQRMA